MTILKPALRVGILVILALILALITQSRGLAGAEVDALSGGGLVVDALFSEKGSLSERLGEGFKVDPEHPRAETYPKRHPWRLDFAVSPLSRWTSACAIMLAPEGVDDRLAARLMAAFLMILAAFWIMSLFEARAGLSAALASLASSAALDAAGGAGSGAISALAMVAFIASTLGMLKRRSSAVWVGLSWGLLLATHPGALFLLIPLFVAVAIAWKGEHKQPALDQETTLALPTVPPLLMAVPLIGVALLVAIWPSLWSHSGRGIAQWLTDTWWAMAPQQQILGEQSIQAQSKAPQAFIASLQWLAWTPWPLLVAWFAGLMMTIRAGRKGLWLPPLLLATILIIGGIDGGLFGARHSLMPWLWVCTAMSAGLGLAPLGRYLGPAIVGVCLISSALMSPWGISSLGPEARAPVPERALWEIAEREPGARVHIASALDGQRFGVQTLRWRSGLDITWSEPEEATWLLILGEEPAPKAWKGEESPTYDDRLSGLRLRAFKR